MNYNYRLNFLTLSLCLLVSTSCFASGKPLDDEYRDRYEVYSLNDGTFFTSRETYWRDIEWQNVEKVCINIRSNIYCVDAESKDNFKGLLRFRWGGRQAKYAGGHFVGFEQINIWTLGWTDGQTAFLNDVDVNTGKLSKEYTMPLINIKSHVHPNLGIEF